MNQPTTTRFEHHENITVGLARVIYEPAGYWLGQSGWFLPGCRFTTNRDEAHACAVAMNTLMGGVQTVRESSVTQEQVDWAVGVITRNWPANQTQGG